MMLTPTGVRAGHGVVAEAPGAHGQPGDHRDHRAVAHPLMDGGLDVLLGLGAVAGAHQLAQPVVGGRGAQEPLEGPRHGVGGRLVAGEDERHELVAQLMVGERLALLVAGGEQHREHVAAPVAVSGRPALADDRVHLAVDHPHHRGEHPLGLEMARVAQLHEQVQGRHRGGQHSPQRLAHPALGGGGVRRHADAEDPAHDHLERHRLHPRRERERLAERPVVDLLARDVGDHRHVALDGLAVKRRQQELALAHVARADRGEHRVGPEDRAQRRLAGERGRIGGVGLEQRAQMVGVAGDDERLAARGHADLPHVAVPPLGAQREGHRPPGEAQPLQRGRQPGCGRHVDRRARLDRTGRRGRLRPAARAALGERRCLGRLQLTVRKCTAPRDRLARG